MSINYKESSNSIHGSIKSRHYAFDSKTLSLEELVKGSFNSIKSYGFCVIDNVIPDKEIPAIHEEILEAHKKSSQNIQTIK